MFVLGVSALFHDSAAALVEDGELVAAAQEERFTRRKNDSSLPRHAIAYCLDEAGVAVGELDCVVFYEKPISDFARMMKTSLHVAPRGFAQFRRAAPGWLKHKLWVAYGLERMLADLGQDAFGEVLFTKHHQAHAASAFHPSPFESAAVITMDGVGEWATTTIGHGTGNQIVPLREIAFPHSLGLLYSAFTYHCGFRVNSGESKLMGLAPYGEPVYRDLILDELIELCDDGSFRLNVRDFGYLSSLRMTNSRFEALFDGPARQPGTEITNRDADLARSVQAVSEEVVLHIAGHAAELTGERNACLAGGVALNAVANGRLLREGPFERVWVQPAAGDAGGALGAALAVWYESSAARRDPDPDGDGMAGCLLGPGYDDDAIANAIEGAGLTSEHLSPAERAGRVAALLAQGHVVGVFDGRMEFGPRALGNRSILADARSPGVQELINERIKKREGFRPFAPAVLEERSEDWFDLDGPMPYMTFVATVAKDKLLPHDGGVAWPPEARLAEARSEIPAVTHVDDTARVQTVSRGRAPRFHEILTEFERLTGCPVLLNTSLNVRGEPIACTPDDAIGVFLNADLDHLVAGNHLLSRSAPSESETA